MFQFKQFVVRQDACAMKVCTDSCLFGAWLEIPFNSKNALDIGTGTGLLSLMIAQRNSHIEIDAIEIDESAYKQALSNVSNSIFKDIIKVINSSLQEFITTTKYDFIISNPPFYENSIKTENKKKNTAHHCSHLSFEELCYSIKSLMTTNGTAAVMLPPNVTQKFIDTAANYQLYLQTKCCVYNHKNKPVFRYFLILKNQETATVLIGNFFIYKDNVEVLTYTDEFKELLNPYYL